MRGIKTGLMLSWVALFLFADIASGTVLKNTERKVLSRTNGITMPFIENKGRLEDPDILFFSNAFACRVSVNRDGSIGYGLPGNKAGKVKQLCEIREKPGGALKTSPSGGQRAMARVSHFKGKDPQQWVKDIPTFNSVNMGEIYQGVSLKLRARGNNVEKVFAVQPGADPKKIKMNIAGANALRLTGNGELKVETGAGSMRFTNPVAYQQIQGRKTPIDVAYTVQGMSYGFKLAAYDKTKELIIDPLIKAIFRGTPDAKSRPTCMAADGRGNIYVAGYSANQYAVLKFDSKLGTLLGEAIFGSLSWSEEGDPCVYDIAIDQQDAVFLVGGTNDADFPVTQGAFDTRFSFREGEYSWLRSDGFVLKCNADLDTILSSTFIGEDGFDVAYGIAVARDGTVYVAGETTGPPRDGTAFPTSPDAYDTTSGLYQKSKAFVIHLNSELQTLMASTLLGYDGEKPDDSLLDDRAYDVAIDANDAVVVAGMTKSELFPVTGNCADGSFEGNSEAFVSKFDPDLKHLLASTFLGGADKERANVLGIAADNEIVVAGWTMSSDFPVVQGNYDTSYHAREDAFVTRLNSELTVIRASTFLGGISHEQVSDMVVGDDGSVFVCGGTASPDFPVTGNFHDNSFNGIQSANDFFQGDGFITILDHSLTALSASTYLGGGWFDHITSILVRNDDIVVAGETSSTDFPYMTVNIGDSDTFICRFNPHEAPEPLPFTGRPGHWRSDDSGTPMDLYLDVNICEDGSFSGILQVYLCPTVGSILCVLPDDAPSIPASGTIDFQNWVGTLNLDDCKDVPFRIVKQIPDEFVIKIDSAGEEGNCFEGARSFFYYQGEPEAGACQKSPGGGGESNGDSNGESGGGSGGGCFLNIMVDNRLP